MFVRVKERPNGKKSIQIVEAHRRADKISQHIVRHVGQAVTEREVEELKKLAQSIIAEFENNKQPVLPLFAPEDFYTGKKRKKATQDLVHMSDLREEQRIIDGIGEVFGKLYSDLGFDGAITGTRRDAKWNSILKTCVMARIANPSSKRRTAALLEEDYGIKVALNDIYTMMDHASDHEDEIKKRISRSTLSLFNDKVDVLFFDVTTLYFESIEVNELKNFGFSKDCKFKEVQVTLALVTTTEGLPITYRVFPGNMHEGHTLIDMVKELKTEYNIDNVLLVADRAMFEEENLQAMETEGVNYIVAAKLKRLNKAAKAEIMGDAGYRADVVTDELHWMKEFDYKSRRLIVSYSTKRARKDRADRLRLVERLLKMAKNGKLKLKDLITNQGTKKYVEVKTGEAVINEEKISSDSAWDGLHGVITNLEKMPAAEVLGKYRGLWQIEEAFRINKHDLKMRPIYHFSPHRIRAHLSICFLAYTLAKQATHRMRLQQEAMSFERLRNELLHIQASLVVDKKTKKRYIIPSHVNPAQNQIYRAFGLKRSTVPYAV
jgi:transposase